MVAAEELPVVAISDGNQRTTAMSWRHALTEVLAPDGAVDDDNAEC